MPLHWPKCMASEWFKSESYTLDYGSSRYLFALGHVSSWSVALSWHARVSWCRNRRFGRGLGRETLAIGVIAFALGRRSVDNFLRVENLIPELKTASKFALGKRHYSTPDPYMNDIPFWWMGKASGMTQVRPGYDEELSFLPIRTTQCCLTGGRWGVEMTMQSSP